MSKPFKSRAYQILRGNFGTAIAAVHAFVTPTTWRPMLLPLFLFQKYGFSDN
ncbi:hypothetical protein PanWU01x14_243390 [Parasponia andersonii]|uniref:Uncharacterized protein n=1 Tax=Parasponia andersonii TaxID=3476 RepID=A0A2P5BFL4_PARAD|nr:hypothetical protein PanWU01x14_243390 [Parasponia andersonii]